MAGGKKAIQQNRSMNFYLSGVDINFFCAYCSKSYICYCFLSMCQRYFFVLKIGHTTSSQAATPVTDKVYRIAHILYKKDNKNSLSTLVGRLSSGLTKLLSLLFWGQCLVQLGHGSFG
jgi:hypothetical protein